MRALDQGSPVLFRRRRRRAWMRLDGGLAAVAAASVLAMWLLSFTAGWLVAMAPPSPRLDRRTVLPPMLAEHPRPRPHIERVAYSAPPRVRVVERRLPAGRSAGILPAPTVYDFRPAVVAIPPQAATLASLIADAAIRRAIPEQLVNAIIRVESDFDPLEVSHKGALGLMQVMPATGERFGVRRYELFDPERNIAAGTAYLAWLLERYDGDLDRTLAAYNAGEGAVDRYDGIPPYPETREYVKRVRAHLRRSQPEVY